MHNLDKKTMTADLTIKKGSIAHEKLTAVEYTARIGEL